MIKFPPVLGKPFQEAPTGDEYRFNCPLCEKRSKGPDTKYHLYANERSGLFFCHRCEAKGHVKFFEKGIADVDATPVGRREQLGEALKVLYGVSVAPKTEFKTADLPDDYFPIESVPVSQATAYLAGRGISFSLAIQRRLGFGRKKNRGRIIFPVFDTKDPTKCVFWVARSYMNGSHSKECSCFFCTAKYANAPGVQRRHFLYGLSDVEGRDEVCVAEGPISALNCGPNAVATLGKHVTKEQLELLSDFKKVQVALDDDAVAQSFSLLNSLRLRGVVVEFIPFPRGRDPGDLGVRKMMELRSRAVRLERYHHPSMFMEFPKLH